MTTLEQPENMIVLELQDLHDKVQQAMEAVELNRALGLAQQGREMANEFQSEEWAQKFDELCSITLTALTMEKEEEQELEARSTPPPSEDLTVLKGIGPSAADKLVRGGFASVRQIASATPQQVASIRGFGPATATKVIEAAKAYLKERSSGADSSPETWSPPSKPTPSRLDRKEPPDEKEELTPYQKVLERQASPQAPDPIRTECYQEKLNLEEEEEEIGKFKDIEEEGREEIEKAEEEEEEKGITDLEENDDDADAEMPSTSKPPKNILETYQSLAEKPSSKRKAAYSPVMRSSLASPPSPAIAANQPPLSPPIQQENASLTKDPSSIKNPPKESQSSPQERSPPLESQVATVLSEAGFRLIAHHQFPEVSHLAYKIISIADRDNLFILLPIAMEKFSEPLVISEQTITTQSRASLPLPSVLEIEQVATMLAEDLTRAGGFYHFLIKYLKLNLKVDPSPLRKDTTLRDGQDQYHFYVEPVVITAIKPYFLEKKIPFAYQRHRNLHLIPADQLANFLEYLETKLALVQSQEKTNLLLDRMQRNVATLNRNLQVSSCVPLGYAGLLSIMYFTQWFYLLRLFLNVGYAILGMYGFVVFYLFYRHDRDKKAISQHLSMPYFRQALQLDPAEAMVVKAELSEELFEQFEFECLVPIALPVPKRVDSPRSSLDNPIGTIPKLTARDEPTMGLSTRSKFSDFLEE